MFLRSLGPLFTPGLAMLAIGIAACNKSEFGRQSRRTPIETPGADVSVKTKKDNVTEGSVKTLGGSDTTENMVEVAKFIDPNQENHIWVVTVRGFIKHFLLKNGSVISSKSWTGITPQSGSRTYVLEGGAIVLTRNGGHIYFLHDGITEGEISKSPSQGLYYKLPGVNPDERSCVVSYRKGNKRYLGVGYGKGFFVEIEQQDTPPFAPRFETVSKPIQIASELWGYSCYVDQTRLYYYSQHEGIAAIDLKTMKALDLNLAPNAAFKSNLREISVGPNFNRQAGLGSYAMSGDRLGNVLNGIDTYTMAVEPRESMVWAPSGANIRIYPHECVYKNPKCNEYGTYDMLNTIGAQVGPLSALGDGHMVGLVRQVGDVYLMRLQVPESATEGIKVTKIAERVGGGVGGGLDDPYMYTDFTGATLYIANSLLEFDFSKSSRWSLKAPIRKIAITWIPSNGSAGEWKDIKSELRCYNDPANKGNFTPVVINSPPNTLQYLDVPSCRDKIHGQAEVRLTQEGSSSSTLMGINRIKLTVFQ